jgi:hypothetical protein
MPHIVKLNISKEHSVMTLPPVMTGMHFNATNMNASAIQTTIGPLFSELVPYLNELLSKVPKERAQYSVQDLSDVAFSDKLRVYDDEWYTYNVGGMDEVQWNIGMGSDRLRFGLASYMEYHPNFPDTSNIKKVTKALEAMKDCIKHSRSVFENFATNAINGMAVLQVESKFFRGQDIVDFFDGSVSGYTWVFLGAFIHRASPVLTDPNALDAIMKETRDSLWDCYTSALSACYGGYKPKTSTKKRKSTGGASGTSVI